MAAVSREVVVPSRISWGAILAGCVISLVSYLILGVLGTAVGAASVDPLSDSDPVSGLGVGAGVWVLASTVLSVLLGAFVAGRVAATRGGLHGLLSWALTTLLTTYLLASLAGGVVGAVGGALGKGLSLASSGVAAVAPGLAEGAKRQLNASGVSLDWDDLQQQLQQLLRQSGKPQLQPQALRAKAGQAANDASQTAQQVAAAPNDEGDISAWFKRLKQTNAPTLQAADREALVNIIAARSGQSHEQAEQVADRYVAAYQQAMARYQELKQQAEQKARQAADIAARELSRGAWFTLAMLLLGALAAYGAGVLGRGGSTELRRTA